MIREERTKIRHLTAGLKPLLALDYAMKTANKTGILQAVQIRFQLLATVQGRKMTCMPQ